MNIRYPFILANFAAVTLLIGILVTPLILAKNFAQVAGVKSESQFLVVPQLDKFPNMKFTQEADKFQITFIKTFPQQAFTGILIVNNPTNETKKYSLETNSTSTKIFFGENIEDRKTKITVPSSASVPVSLFSPKEASAQSQTVEFKIIAQ